jgi:carboxyl-terminal processing protease
LQDVPEDMTDSSSIGEASLRGHLKGDAGKEQTGSQSYVPPDKSKDKALLMAEGLLRGTELSSAFPPKVRGLSDQN